MKMLVCASLVTLGALVGTMPAAALEIIAHRGASYDAPENTLASFKLGYKQHADANELDIYLTKDGRIVVAHDRDTGRVSGVTNKIETQTFKQLRRLEVGRWGKWKDGRFSEKTPALDEVLARLPRDKRLFIEIKCGPEVLPELERTLRHSRKKPEQIVLIGFSYETMQLAKLKLPQFEVCWLVGRDKETKAYAPIEELVRKAGEAHLDGLDLESGFPIDASFVRKVHGAGLKLYTWTVDDPVLARTEADAGVDGITTNRPGWLREQLSARSAP